jgi:hypothetical protein
MPIVNLVYRSEIVPENRIRHVTHMLRYAVAQFITEADPDIRFSVTDVTINCDERGRYDLCEKDISIVIFANYSEERFKKVDEISEKISKAVSGAVKIAGVTNYVYLVLTKAGYHSSEAKNDLGDNLFERKEFDDLFNKITGIKADDALVGEDGFIFIPPEADLENKSREDRDRIAELAGECGWRNHIVDDQYAGWWIRRPK